MEKITLKPQSQELMLKGGASEGHLDIFAYDGNGDDAAQRLGSLYVIGNVQEAQDDASYITNLIASLAKREYYVDPALTPRDSFSATLRKINEVVEEFFKNKGLKINIGIFAIAGENILISKLGKFRILLARDNQNIDILNNIQLFNKEHLEEEHEFSNIVSGKVRPDDRILAFYPGKSMTSREKFIKDSFLKLPTAEFIQKVTALQETKPDFSCAALCVQVAEFKETLAPATPTIDQKRPRKVVPPVQDMSPSPAEMAPVLTKSVGTKGTKAKLAKASAAPQVSEPLPVSEPSPMPPAEATDTESSEPEIPRIIPAEFALGKKANPLARLTRNWSLKGNSRKMIVYPVVAGIVIAGGLMAKGILFSSPATKAEDAIVSQAQDNLKAAQSQIAQNNIGEARKLLTGSLYQILALNGQDNYKASQTKTDLLSTLDNAEQARDASLTLVTQIPGESGKATLIGAGTDRLVAYLPHDAASGSLAIFDTSGVKETFAIKAQQPTSLLQSEGDFLLITKNSGDMTVFKKDKTTMTSSVTLPEGTITAGFYKDNLYIIANGGIFKIGDLPSGATKTDQWLATGATLPANPALITLDGKAYVLTTDGTLATYYKGQKSLDIQTSLSVDENTILLNSEDSKFFFLVNKKLGRIYKVGKDTGTIDSVVKIGSTESILDASIDPAADTLYLLTSDNKVWKVGL